jgi:hypothetical protein
MPKTRSTGDSLDLLERIILATPPDEDALKRAVRNPALTEELALALLQRRDLSPDVSAELAKNGRVLKHRKVRVGLIMHPRTPRHVTLPQMRHLFTFDLMQVTLSPHVATDIRMVADEMLVTRMKTMSSGERLTLARRGSGRTSAELLLDPEPRVVTAALNNSRLTEALLVRALGHPDPSRELAQQAAQHEKWSACRDVRLALLRHPHTPLSAAITFTETFSPRFLEDVLSRSELPENTRYYLLRIAERRRQANA